MKRFLYIMPAVLILMLYALLTVLAGGISGFQPIAFLYILLPVLAGIFLRKDRWWGCLFGMAMGAVLLYNSMTAQPRLAAGIAGGAVLAGYYAVMGLVCGVSRKKK